MTKQNLDNVNVLALAFAVVAVAGAGCSSCMLTSPPKPSIKDGTMRMHNDQMIQHIHYLMCCCLNYSSSVSFISSN